MNAIEERRDILIVEDDADIAELVSLYLHNHGFTARVASSLAEAVGLLNGYRPALIICDIMLPDGSGKEWIQTLKLNMDIQVIFLSSLKESEDIISGLEHGDDYITKPFDPDIMIARVKARLRSSSMSGGAHAAAMRQVWSDGQLELDFIRNEARLNGKELVLTAKELQLLLYMAGHPGQVFSVEQLYEQVWGLEHWSDTRTVMVHVHHLRRKLEEYADSPHRYIATVRGIGYKFQGDDGSDLSTESI